MGFICDVCGYEFSLKNNLKRHIENKHQKDNSKRKKSSRIICYKCQCTFITFVQYHKHLMEDHNEALDFRITTFSKLEDFQQWQRTTEKNSKSKFVKRCQHKKLKDGSKMVYYFCHRSFNERNKRNPKKSKKVGTNKIGYACPALMKVHIKETEIEVEFCSSHRGHICEVERLTLDTEERAFLAGKLKEGVSMSKILDDIRGQRDEAKDDEIQRIQLLKRSDLRRIRKSFNIECPSKHDENRFQFVENECQIEESEVILENDCVYLEENQIHVKNDYCDHEEYSYEALKSEIIAKCNLIQEYALKKTLNDEQYRQVLKYLDQTMAVYQEEDNVPNVLFTFPINDTKNLYVFTKKK